MPKAFTPRRGGAPKGRRPAPVADLPRDVVEEIQRVTRPTEVRDALSRLSRATELLERGDTGAASAEAAKAKQLAPRSAAVREVLGLSLYGQERWQEALTELKAYRRMSERADQNHSSRTASVRWAGRQKPCRWSRRSSGPRCRTRRRPKR